MKDKLKELKKIYLLCSGWIRCKIYHFCPKCNSDAPNLYDCTVCNYYRGIAPRSLRNTWFNKFKKEINER